jgi:hypothetical protein
MGYRLGADPERHGVTDCFGLAKAVVEHYGYTAPAPTRDWYRRLRRGDYTVFREELERWGQQTANLDCGVIALCQADKGYGLAVFWEDGWLSFAESAVKWSPIGALPVVACFSAQKLPSAKPSA